jgi:hypothetical protein
LDEHGNEDNQHSPVDQNDFDIPRTEVDDDDIHLATMSKKFTRERVRVKRKFKGAKIVDLEKRADIKPPPYYHHRDLFEPERNPDDLSPSHAELRSPVANYDIGEMFPEDDLIEPVEQRLANLAKIIDNYDQETKGWDAFEDIFGDQDLPETGGNLAGSQPQFKRPNFANRDLGRVYGASGASLA